MLVVIAYDVSTDSAGGAKRLRRVARLCENHGARVSSPCSNANSIGPSGSP